MDFDDLKRAWDDCDHRLASGIHLNARRVLSMMALDANPGDRPATGDIDYTMSVALAQEQLHTHRVIRFIRSAAALIGDGERADRLVGTFQSTVMRLLGRHRTLRG